MPSVQYDFSLLTEMDIYLFKQGRHSRLYEKLGAHVIKKELKSGTYFALWAPNAREVTLIGDFNSWDTLSHPLKQRDDDSGIWEGFVPELGHGNIYKYHIISNYNDYKVDKADPFGFFWEVSPETGSIVWDLDYQWQDGNWMQNRSAYNSLEAPISVYEVHLGSWFRDPENDQLFLSFRELGPKLAQYALKMGFTHIEFLPVMEHPFYGSWGYQTLGYFAPSSRFGTPQDFMYLVDYLHQSGLGVILDWVPSHFPSDEHGLVYFDGTHLYEHADPKKGYHPDWKSCIFNYGRNEVVSYLVSSAMFWLDKYHADSLRVDAVASMLYLDYSRNQGEWIPNEFGGRENLEAIEFLRFLNKSIYGEFPDVQTIAEESTDWPMVTRPVHLGGLGFGLKWNMGWMHDTLLYMSQDPIFRKYHHDQLTFSIWYAFTENFQLPLSHDEVVHGKGSLVQKMPGDKWQKFANLRLLFGYMYTHPGKKVLFMGNEFGQFREWQHEAGLDWDLLKSNLHQGLSQWFKDMNLLYKNEKALHQLDLCSKGFEWIDSGDWENSVLSYLRLGKSQKDCLLIIANFTPVPRLNYSVGVPVSGFWTEILNSDATEYGGSGQGNLGGRQANLIPCHGRDYSLTLNLPPLGLIAFKPGEMSS